MPSRTLRIPCDVTLRGYRACPAHPEPDPVLARTFDWLDVTLQETLTGGLRLWTPDGHPLRYDDGRPIRVGTIPQGNVLRLQRRAIIRRWKSGELRLSRTIRRRELFMDRFGVALICTLGVPVLFAPLVVALGRPAALLPLSFLLLLALLLTLQAVYLAPPIAERFTLDTRGVRATLSSGKEFCALWASLRRLKHHGPTSKLIFADGAVLRLPQLPEVCFTLALIEEQTDPINVAAERARQARAWTQGQRLAAIVFTLHILGGAIIYAVLTRAGMPNAARVAAPFAFIGVLLPFAALLQLRANRWQKRLAAKRRRHEQAKARAAAQAAHSPAPAHTA